MRVQTARHGLSKSHSSATRRAGWVQFLSPHQSQSPVNKFGTSRRRRRAICQHLRRLRSRLQLRRHHPRHDHRRRHHHHRQPLPRPLHQRQIRLPRQLRFQPKAAASMFSFPTARSSAASTSPHSRGKRTTAFKSAARAFHSRCAPRPRASTATHRTSKRWQFTTTPVAVAPSSRTGFLPTTTPPCSRSGARAGLALR